MLDISTNSVEFTLGDRHVEGGAPHLTADTAVVTRLGEGLVEPGQFHPQAMGRTVDAVAGLVDDARNGMAHSTSSPWALLVCGRLATGTCSSRPSMPAVE